MAYEIVRNMEPHEFFDWFGRISEIPRGSGNERRFIEFLCDYAQKRGFYCETDAAGNTFMRVPATLGYEDQPSILLQAHMDIVCAKEPGVIFDFFSEPIHLCVDGDQLHAKGTTLGADNGVGLATMLALGDAKDIPHPELELLFTVEEEIGLKGIRKFDMGHIRSRRMINMDCGDSHVVCVSSAGRITGTVNKQYVTQQASADDSGFMIAVSGGLGGHSGLMVNKGRACTGNILGLLLAEASAFSMRLCTINSSNKAILKECCALIAFPRDIAPAAIEKIHRRFDDIHAIYQRTDPGLKLEIVPCREVPETLNEKDSANIAALLSLLHTGPYRLNSADASTVVTSSSLGPVSFEKGLLKVVFSVRSSNDTDLTLLFEKYSFIAKRLGVEITLQDKCPRWEERLVSPFRDKFNAAHKRLFHTELELERAQGCVEVSFITESIPDIDAIGIAPTARGAHTPQECLYISEVAPFWRLLKEVLSEKERSVQGSDF